MSKFFEARIYRKSVVKAVILTIVTFGIYNLFWQNHQIKTINYFMEKRVLSFWRWLFLTIFTFGLYHIYHEYLVAKYILEIQNKVQKPITNPTLPQIAILLTILGFALIVDAIEQKELNDIIDYVTEKAFYKSQVIGDITI